MAESPPVEPSSACGTTPARPLAPASPTVTSIARAMSHLKTSRSCPYRSSAGCTIVIFEKRPDTSFWQVPNRKPLPHRRRAPVYLERHYHRFCPDFADDLPLADEACRAKRHRFFRKQTIIAASDGVFRHKARGLAPSAFSALTSSHHPLRCCDTPRQLTILHTGSQEASLHFPRPESGWRQ
jgi:hypothetical protein